MIRKSILGIPNILAVCGALAAAPAIARGDEVGLSIPSMALDDALQLYAVQTGDQIIIPAGLAGGARSHGVSGALSRDAALRRILTGTGLRAVRSPQGVVSFQKIAMNSAAPVVVAQAAAPSPAPQPEPAAAPVDEAAGGLEDIVVTAQKREESLQRTPVTVTALSERALETRSINNVSDLQASVPGLVIGGNANFGGINSISIRGVNAPILPIGTEDAVGVYLDGVYLPRSDAAFFNFADVERIEVLRGPQGTLYGRNTTGGAINITTRTPPDHLEGRLEANFGNFDEYQAKAYLGAPLGENAAFSVSAVKSGHDGYFRNANTGNRVGNADDFTGRAKLRFEQGGFSALLAGDYSLLKAEDHFQNLRSTATGAFVGVGDPDIVESDIEDLVHTRRVSWGGSLTLRYEFTPETSLTSITSYRSFRTRSTADTDGQGTAAPFLYTISGLGNKQWSQEIRLNHASDTLDLIAGLNYFHDKAYLDYETQSNTGPNFFNNTAKTIAYAAFAQLDYHLSPETTLIAGLRYNHDRKSITALYPALGVLPETFTADTRNDEAFLPKIGITHQLNPDIFVFATVSRGYRAGSYSPSPGRGRPIGPGAPPEKLTNYELGIKTELFDRQMRLNTTFFYEDYRNLQVRQTVAPAQTVINSAGRARLYGAEVESNIILGGGFGIDGTLSLLHAEYTALTEQIVATFFDRSGNRLVRAPRMQFSVNGHYAGQITDDLRLNANLSFYRETKSFYSAENNPVVGNNGWHSLDTRIAVSNKSGWEVYAFGKNLTGKRYITNVLTLGAYYPATLNYDTRYGVGVKYSF